MTFPATADPVADDPCQGLEAGRAVDTALADNPDLKPEILTYSHCVRCHEANPARPKWHKQIVADWKGFDSLEEEALHDLRKRIKRQRYAVEFFAPVLRRRRVDRYLEALAEIQDRMGELNDLFVARDRYQSVLQTHPAAWFALGWLAARIAEVRAAARPALGRLARVDPPVC